MGSCYSIIHKGLVLGTLSSLVFPVDRVSKVSLERYIERRGEEGKVEGKEGEGEKERDREREQKNDWNTGNTTVSMLSRICLFTGAFWMVQRPVGLFSDCTHHCSPTHKEPHILILGTNLPISYVIKTDL